jgi:hypothetical protein
VIRVTLAAAFALATASGLPAADSLNVKIGYLGRVERTETISLLEQPASNNGVAGAQLAIEDNNTTGKFLNQSFSIEATRLKGGDDPVVAAMQLADRGVSLIILDLPADMLLKAAEAGRARGLFLFNASAVDDRLRQEDCRADVIHVAPSRSMLADGLAQYLVWKRWRRWLLVVGSHDPDKLYADAVRRAAGRYGVKIVQERVFQDTGGARRTDSGLVQIQSQIPLFTQSVPDYDVLVAADESQVFASYLPYRTHDARPVAGSAGLVPTSWDASFQEGHDPFALPGLHFTRQTAESVAINSVHGGAIIMAGSGMCTGGRVRHHLQHNIGREDSSIVFVGYAASGTLARRIIDGAKQVNIFGEDIAVRARIYTINGFSAHADQAELLAWQKQTSAKRTFLVHGEDDTMRQFAAHLANTHIEMPEPNQVFEL